ncbi:hypothetical protein BH11ACT4_BH11ACT4_13130 [soil metagenome]
MVHLTTSAGGLIVSGLGRIAVVSQITRSMSLPKGHVEAGETELEAARREIHEEIGLVVGEPITRYPPYTRHSGRRPDETKRIVMFLFTVDGEPALRSGDPDNAHARWLSPDNAANALTYDEDRDFLASALPGVISLS